MTLREELKPREEPTMSRIDHKLHDDIERQMAEFVSRGGRVNIIPSGVGIDNLAKLEVRNEFDNTKPGEYAERRKKAQNGANAQAAKRELTPLTVFSQKKVCTTRRQSGHQNIVNNYKSFSVVIGQHKAGPYDTVEEAIAKRDELRILFNMHPASY